MSTFFRILTIATQVIFAKGDYGYDTFRIPAIIKAANGDLIAFAEARKNGAGDTGDIDLVMRRSSDNGKSWGEMRVIWDDGVNVCGNPAPVVDAESGRLLLLLTWNDGRDPERAINKRTSIDTRRVFVTCSEDNGYNWSTPREITADTKDPQWTWYATGPCHAIQMRKGPHKGRLIVPCDHGVFGGHYASHIIYSDDGGESWHLGGDVGDGNESTVCEVGHGRLLLNMRANRKRKDSSNPWRLTAISKDGGMSFTKAVLDKNLPEPVCQGSIISDTRRTVYFSNPANISRRKNMTLRKSTNAGKSWKRSVELPGTFAAYSDLCILEDGSVAILYETGETTAYDTISFAIVNI